MNDKQAFVKALAQFVAGNPVGKSISLQMPPGVVAWPKEWQALSLATPVRGYATVEEAEAILRDWLNIPSTSSDKTKKKSGAGK